ncbi:sigma 54-interacting transcriptional regulator [Desulfofalx alkaliphila]|uniref:sigma 54-interacting transcriptional regulator n=1 Tax=Desulfofalx alkaliphila TaxID=105483 RepID=UPI0004E0CE59|nr:sigma 54-interacting transcriptional regulator [Desulfofalx alkaliphila]
MLFSLQAPKSLVYETLQGLNLFKDVPADQLHIISKGCNIVTLRNNQHIVSQGDMLRNFFIVLHGELEVYVEDEFGEKFVLHRLLAGDYYGDICLLTGEPSHVSINSAKRSKIIIFDDEAFQKLIQLIPQINNTIIKNLSYQLKQINIKKTSVKNKQLALSNFLLESRTYLKKLVGKSRFTKKLRHIIDEQAKHCEPLLITGEKGTGKLLVANLIHNKSIRKKFPFIVVDCEELVHDVEGIKLLGPLSKETSQLYQFSYLDLAKGGSLYLNDIELLPKETLLRLLKYVDQHRDVRIIMASTVTDPGQYIERKKTGINTASLFNNSLHLDPLRSRKRDIPELINYFVNLKCKKYEKETNITLSSDAVEKLLSHDYQQSNIQELEEIIDRAVLLTDGEVIEADSIIIGEVNRSRPGFNLLDLSIFKELVYKRTWPQRVQMMVTVIFLGVLIISFWGGHQFQWINVFTWKVLGPAVILGALLLGRVVCSVCPFSMLAALAQNLKCYSKQLPKYLTHHYYIIFIFLFSLIFWYEEFFNIKDSPYLTGLLLATIAAAAITCGFIYKGHVWCRYMCPLGAIFSVCSTLSLVELRAKTDVCQNKCQTFNCFKGNTRSGCPMLLHAMYIDSNINCKLCLKCVTNCPNNSITFSIRPPGREIWQLSNVHGGIAALVLFFAFMLIPPLTIESLKNLYPDHWKLLFNLFYWLLFSLLLAVVVVFLRKHISSKNFTPYLRMSLAFVPLLTASHVSYQLGAKFDELNSIFIQLVFASQAPYLLTVSACNFTQSLLMIVGLLLTLYCLFRVFPQLKHRWVGGTAFGFSLAYCFIILLFLCV